MKNDDTQSACACRTLERVAVDNGDGTVTDEGWECPACRRTVGAPSNEADLFRQWKESFDEWRAATNSGQSYLRPEVRAFARAMEDGLRRHDDERGESWKIEGTEYLHSRAHGKLRDLLAASGLSDARLVLRKAASAANFSMMVADVCGGLKREADDE